MQDQSQLQRVSAWVQWRTSRSVVGLCRTVARVAALPCSLTAAAAFALSVASWLLLTLRYAVCGTTPPLQLLASAASQVCKMSAPLVS